MSRMSVSYKNTIIEIRGIVAMPFIYNKFLFELSETIFQ